MRKAGQSAPAPREYLTMIELPRQRVITPPRWDELSVWDQHLMMTMLAQESDPIYRRTD